MSTLIGLGGKLRAGKDEVANYLAEQHDYVTMGMSDALNDALLKLNPWIPLLEPLTLDNGATVTGTLRYGSLHSLVGYVEAKKNPEVRRLLQALGTEVGRDMIDPEVWVRIAQRRITELLESGHNVVITAVRFPNELEMIHRLGGTTVWIDRPDEARGASQEQSSHASETSVSLGDFDHAIRNDGTLANLRTRTENLVNNLAEARRILRLDSRDIPYSLPYDR